jgi:hypothetical protein
MKIIAIFTVIIITIILALGLILINVVYNSKNTNTIVDISRPTTYPITSTPFPITIDYNSTLNIPPSDSVINNINWSSYPNLQTGYVYLAEVQGPNEYINHKFVVVQILTEIKGTEDKNIIIEQLSGIAREVRKTYGPNSGVHIISTKGGVAGLSVSMLPYSDLTY